MCASRPAPFGLGIPLIVEVEVVGQSRVQTAAHYELKHFWVKTVVAVRTRAKLSRTVCCCGKTSLSTVVELGYVQ